MNLRAWDQYSSRRPTEVVWLSRNEYSCWMLSMRWRRLGARNQVSTATMAIVRLSAIARRHPMYRNVEISKRTGSETRDVRDEATNAMLSRNAKASAAKPN